MKKDLGLTAAEESTTETVTESKPATTKSGGRG